MPEPALVTLERWEASGAHWRVLRLTGEEAEVEMLTCLGEPVDRLRSSEPELLAYLARRPDSQSAP